MKRVSKKRTEEPLYIVGPLPKPEPIPNPNLSKEEQERAMQRYRTRQRSPPPTNFMSRLPHAIGPVAKLSVLAAGIVSLPIATLGKLAVKSTRLEPIAMVNPAPARKAKNLFVGPPLPEPDLTISVREDPARTARKKLPKDTQELPGGFMHRPMNLTPELIDTWAAMITSEMTDAPEAVRKRVAETVKARWDLGWEKHLSDILDPRYYNALEPSVRAKRVKLYPDIYQANRRLVVEVSEEPTGPDSPTHFRTPERFVIGRDGVPITGSDGKYMTEPHPTPTWDEARYRIRIGSSDRSCRTDGRGITHYVGSEYGTSKKVILFRRPS